MPLLTLTEATRRARSLLSFVGCNSSLSNSDMLTCAQGLNANVILGGIYGVKKINNCENFGLTFFGLYNITLKECISSRVLPKNF